MTMREPTTVRLPTELLERARRKAAADGLTLTALIEKGLRLALRPHGPLPVSKATGGTLPGIDIKNSAAIQEIEDMEYVERMKTFR